MIDITHRLREATAEAHRKLETDLDLLAEPLDRQRFLHVLARFHGFHRVWEDAIARHGALARFASRRRKLPLLARDLGFLGLGAAEIEALPACLAAEDLVASKEQALGSLYVLEGSTLGGKIISRALAGAPWLMSGTLHYFDPYGPETGIMWRDFQDMLRQISAPETDPIIEQGALDTFKLLQSWLVQA